MVGMPNCSLWTCGMCLSVHFHPHFFTPKNIKNPTEPQNLCFVFCGLELKSRGGEIWFNSKQRISLINSLPNGRTLNIRAWKRCAIFKFILSSIFKLNFKLILSAQNLLCNIEIHFFRNSRFIAKWYLESRRAQAATLCEHSCLWELSHRTSRLMPSLLD